MPETFERDKNTLVRKYTSVKKGLSKMEAFLRETYDIDVRQVTVIREGVLCVVDNSGRKYAVKRVRGDAEDAAFIAVVSRHLARAGARNVPGVLLTLRGQASDVHQGTRWMVRGWVNGERPDFANPQMVHKAVRTLARFHRKACQLPSGTIPPQRVKYDDFATRIDTSKQFILAHDDEKTQHDMLALCEMSLSILQSQQARRGISNERQQRALIHGDFNYPNLVLQNAKSLHIIDLDAVALDVRVRDLSHILHRNATWDADAMMRLIALYDRVRALSREECHLLAAYLLHPYPVVRRLRQHVVSGRSHSLQVIPNRQIVRRYVRQIHALTE